MAVFYAAVALSCLFSIPQNHRASTSHFWVLKRAFLHLENKMVWKEARSAGWTTTLAVSVLCCQSGLKPQASQSPTLSVDLYMCNSGEYANVTKGTCTVRVRVKWSQRIILCTVEMFHVILYEMIQRGMGISVESLDFVICWICWYHMDILWWRNYQLGYTIYLYT